MSVKYGPEGLLPRGQFKAADHPTPASGRGHCLLGEKRYTTPSFLPSASAGLKGAPRSLLGGVVTHVCTHVHGCMCVYVCTCIRVHKCVHCLYVFSIYVCVCSLHGQRKKSSKCCHPSPPPGQKSKLAKQNAGQDGTLI